MTPKGTQGMDWDDIFDVLGLILRLILFLVAPFCLICYVLAHFILKYW